MLDRKAKTKRQRDYWILESRTSSRAVLRACVLEFPWLVLSCRARLSKLGDGYALSDAPVVVR
jgi:hypothetical protein